MPTLTRRQLLDALAAAVPLASLACRSKELLPEERICVHVYPESLALPASVLQEFGKVPSRTSAVITFTTGLPELFVCTTPIPFLQLFPFFWPVEPLELQEVRKSVHGLFQFDLVSSAGDAARAVEWLASQKFRPGTVGVFTYNDFTRYFARPVLLAFRQARLSEVVVFKDPSVPPYLCDAPAVQKKFRRPPP